MDTTLEHFAHVEDVVAFVKKHLPPEADSSAWKNVCEDVLHCELTKVEPLLFAALQKKDEHAHTEDEIRALVRAASWYTHPQRSAEVLAEEALTLKSVLEAAGIKDAGSALDLAITALEDHLTEHEALPAANALELLIEKLRIDTAHASFLTPVRELRDQIYYQLLYPHWFMIVNQWKKNQSEKGVS